MRFDETDRENDQLIVYRDRTEESFTAYKWRFRIPVDDEFLQLKPLLTFDNFGEAWNSCIRKHKKITTPLSDIE